ncbi:MAG: Crp/Fnr family transcriptional regulator [Pseudobdellovibrionaceae bacterium]
MSGSKKILKDHYLFREGDAPDALYVVKTGKLAVVKAKANSEIVLAEIGPGSMVGEMAFFDNKPRSASVKAMKDTEVVALPYKALHAQFVKFPEWTKAIMRTVNNSLRDANQRIKTLERNDNEKDMFPPHTINKLLSILNLVAHKYGKPSEEGLAVNGGMVRNYTIQIFQEATHKMQKLMVALEELKFMKVEDQGEGRTKVTIFKPELLFAFVEWHNEWLFLQEKDRTLIKEEELKIAKTMLHFAKKVQPNAKGFHRVNLTDVQNDSMREMGFLVKTDDVNSLIEKKVLTDKVQDGPNLFVDIKIEDLDKTIPFWDIIYALKKVTR